METVQLLERHLCSQHIYEICKCTSDLNAKQMIVKCLTEKATCKSEILEFCEILLSLKNASQLVHIVENLRTGMYVNYDYNYSQVHVLVNLILSSLISFYVRISMFVDVTM